MRRTAVCLTLALLSSLVPAALGRAASADGTAGEPVVVQLDPAASDAERADALTDSGLRVIDETEGSAYVLALRETSRPISGDAIDSVRPLVTYRATGIPNDPAYGFQWHLAAIDAAAAWDVTTGTGVVVAVLDSGAAYEDSGAFRRAPDLAAATFVPGWDFVDGDAHPNDENGHGTHVTSAIAAATNNSEGVAGVAPGVRIMPLRVLDAAGTGSDFAAAQALRYAADHGAKVANMSFGSPTPSGPVAEAVAYARSKGVTIVAASGNGETGVGGAVSYPAAIEGVIAVGAVRYDRTRASYSNYGPSLDIVAPGGDVTVDQNNDSYVDGILQETFVDADPTAFGYGFLQGTSMAAPQVSAVAALLVSRGVTSPDAIEQTLEATALDLGTPGRDDEYGHGLLQSGAAVRATVPAGLRGITNACPSDRTPPPPFTDLGSSTHAAAVGCVAWWGVASGTSATSFNPNGRMTRAQLASFVARELEAAGYALAGAPQDVFTDDETSVHELRINQLAAAGVVQGRGGTTYAPNATVTRAEMATFLVRAHDRLAPPLPGGPDRFFDDAGSVHEANINKVAAAGLAAGTSATRFAPSSPVLRGQMAAFLARLLDLFVDTGVTPPR